MTKYIDAEHLLAEIEKHIKEVKDVVERFTPNMGFFDAKLSGIYDVMAIIDSLQQEQPSLPDNLDEAANKFAVLYDQGTCDGIAQECFKAGAQWMENQFEHCGTFPVEDPNGGYWPTDYYVKKK